MAKPTSTRVALVGMSGIGKSYWSQQLEQLGWARYDCDAMIADRLGELIDIKPGEDAVIAVGRWMGMPWTAGYAEREAQYLDLERQVTAQALDAMAELPEDQPAILDTTGSVIYTGDALLDRIRQQCKVVYLDAPESVREQMVALYCDQPKPVLWQGGYRAEPGESQADALSRCYSALLADRTTQYARLAQVTLDYHALRAPGTGIEHLLGQITG